MKKALIVLLLLAVVAGGLFAQLTKEIVVDYVPNLFLMQSDNHGDSEINFLTSGNGDYFDGTEMRLNLTYVNENVKAFLQTKLDTLIARGSTGFSGNSLDWSDLLEENFGDYYVDANADMFGGNYRLYLGNTANRGVTDRFQDFHDFLKTKSDNFGIQMVSFGGSTGSVTITDSDTNNFQQKTPHGYTAPNPWFGFFAKYEPFTVALAGSMADPFGDAKYDHDNDPNTAPEASDSYRKINAAIRFSGEKMLDGMLGFDVIYKLHNFDQNTLNNYDENDTYTFEQPDGTGITTHNFGAYANVFLLKNGDKNDLGLAIGYSGSVRMKEDTLVHGNPDKTKVTKYPFYNGIDIRAKYTGIDKLTVTFNNNFSISGVTGSDEDTMMSFDGVNNVGKDTKQSYWALYNALGAAYKLTDPLTLKFQIGSRLVSANQAYSAGGNDIEGKIFYNKLGLAVFAQYAVNAHFEFRCGLDFINEYNKMTQTATGNEDKEKTAGRFTFGIPIGVLLKF